MATAQIALRSTPRWFFGLCSVRQNGWRSDHLALAILAHPQAWLQRGVAVTHIWAKENVVQNCGS